MYNLDMSILDALPKNHYWGLDYTSRMGLAYLVIYKKRWWQLSGVRVYDGLLYRDYSRAESVYREGENISEYDLMKNSQRISHYFDLVRLR